MTANDPGHINNLSENEKEILKDLWKYFLEHFDDKVCNEIERKELFEMFGLDNPDVIFLRFLRARKWNRNLAFDQLIQTIQWRIQLNIQEMIINGEENLCLEEILTGKTFYLNEDKFGRPINYVSVKDHIKGQFSSQSTEQYTIFTMELGRKLLKYPNECVTILFDLNGFSMKNMDYQHVKFLINLLENYYPESLGLALVINSSWLFQSCWYIIKGWLDPIVQSKIHFIHHLKELNEYIHLSNLPQRLNGSYPDFNYIPSTDQEKLIISTIHQDYYGKSQAKQFHQQASIHYLQMTLQWTKEKDSKDLLEQRQKAQDQLKYAYEQLIPYISTRTHYHRIGLINEPIFDITYANIRKQIQEKIVFF